MGIIEKIKEFARKQKLIHGRAKDSRQLREKLGAIDLSYEKALTDKLDGARNRALLLIIIGLLLAAIPMIFSDSLPPIEKKTNETVGTVKEQLYGNKLFSDVSDFFYFSLKDTPISGIYLGAVNIVVSLVNIIGFALPAICLFAILVYFNKKEEQFWIKMLKGNESEKEKKTKAISYLAQPFLALLASYVLLTIILYILSMANCNALACRAATDPSSIGANALKFSMLSGLYFIIIGFHYTLLWFQSMKLGIEEIKKHIREFKEIE